MLKVYGYTYRFRAILIAALVFMLDQGSKELLIPRLADISVIPILPFFNIVMVWNYGISFGMFAEHNQPYIWVAVSLLIVGILLHWLWNTTSMWVAVALGLTIGGALGNVVDRIRYGAVADFFDFYIQNLHWPAFNIADSAIFIGVVLLCIHGMFMEPKK